MLLKIKKFNFVISMFIDNENVYFDLPRKKDKPTILTKISNEERKIGDFSHNIYIKVLYNNKVGWINKEFVQEIS